MTPKTRQRSTNRILRELRNLNDRMRVQLDELSTPGRVRDYRAVGELGQVIRTARRQRGLTQKDLAGRVGLGVRTVGAVEKGADSISLANLRKILEELGIGIWIR